MRTSALCVCFTAVPLVAGADPNRVMFPFRLPDNALTTKNHKITVTGEKNFQHTCFDFVYSVAKLDGDFKANQTMSERIGSFCTMGSSVHCEKWSSDLAQVLQQKKLKTKNSGSAKGPRTYSQWCEEVFSMPEAAKPAQLHVMGVSEIPKQPTQEEEETKQKVHHDTAKVSLKHHSVSKNAVTKQNTEAIQPADKLRDCVCNTREGHNICRCAGNVKTVDGEMETPQFSAAAVETKVEGYEIEQVAQKFNAADSRIAGSLDSAILSLDKAFNASHKLK